MTSVDMNNDNRRNNDLSDRDVSCFVFPWLYSLQAQCCGSYLVERVMLKFSSSKSH